MRRGLTLIAIVAVAAVAVSRAAGPSVRQVRPPAPAAPSGFDSRRAWENLRQMVATGPRPAGSPALIQTRAYITHQLASYGLTVQEQPFQARTPVGTVNMVNLLVTLKGPRPERIIFAGHYDTKLLRNRVFVGASDGASSAAELMELARVLKDRPRAFTYEFLWFDGEEAFCEGWDECGTPGSPDHTYGSRYYLQAAQKAGATASIHAMILLDMIGAKDLRVQRDGGSARWLNDLVWAAAKRLNFGEYFRDIDTDITDDHTAWVQAGIPCIDIIDLNDYPEWHQPTDDLDHVSAHSLQVVGDVVLAALPEIEKHTGTPIDNRKSLNRQ
jgi:Zn-dependent M28 family amino/carboxypeptidase